MSDELKELLGSSASSFEENQEFIQSVIEVAGASCLEVVIPAVMCKLSGKKAPAKKKPAKKKS